MKISPFLKGICGLDPWVISYTSTSFGTKAAPTNSMTWIVQPHHLPGLISLLGTCWSLNLTPQPSLHPSPRRCRPWAAAPAADAAARPLAPGARAQARGQGHGDAEPGRTRGPEPPGRCLGTAGVGRWGGGEGWWLWMAMDVNSSKVGCLQDSYLRQLIAEIRLPCSFFD